MCKMCKRGVLLVLVILAVSMLGLAQRPSPPAQTQCTFSDGNIIGIDYSSPRMKGRKIFGGVVPYGQVFRTGANEATTFVTTTNLIVGGKNVPAGSYTIFTIPSEAQWTLIINKKTGEWGTPYQYESDELARIDMHVSQTASSFENFTVAFDPKGDSCPLTISWENTQASVQIAEIMPGAHATIDLAILQQRAHTGDASVPRATPPRADTHDTPNATQSAPPDPDDQVRAQEEQRQQRITELQSDIGEQEQEATRWEQSESNMNDNSNCSGVGAAICQSIGNLGAGKARQNANKARNQADKDRRELAQLEGQPAPVFRHRDTSYAGALTNQQQQHPSPSVLDAGNQQAAAIRATGDANAAQQQAAAQQHTAAQRATQQTAPNGPSNAQSGASQSAGAALPTGHTSAPLTVRFGNISGYQGNAHVVSTPSGIDCPSTCSFQFGQNAAVMLFATADQNSAVKSLSCQMSSGTGMLQAGNSMSCSIPQWAFEGPQVIVYVDPYSLSGSGAGTGTGVSGGSGGGSSSGQGSGSGSNGASPNAGRCTDATKYVTGTVKIASDGFVVGHLTNNSNQTLYVSYTFARGGKPAKGMGVGGAVTIRAGQTVGGEGAGIWASGVDTNPPQIYFYGVLQSDADQGKNCGSAW